MAQVLRNQPKPTDPNLLVGIDFFDDAGVYRINDTTALVLTVDFFPPLVDDPYQFGRVAAANALSDVYAMGGRPIAALNLVGFPDQELPAEILGKILRGGHERVTAAGAVIAGGHSIRDQEVKYGMAVTGLVHPDRIVANAGARAGDVLVLTKPIGSGILASAAKVGEISAADFQETIDIMTELNAGACTAMLEVGVHAATDITGFGLLGHAHELAHGSGVTVEIDSGRVPLLAKALELADGGIITRAYASNLEYLGDRLLAEGADELLVDVLADAQTSGGLLIAVAPDRVDALLAALRRERTPCAAVIGRVSGPSAHTIVVR